MSDAILALCLGSGLVVVVLAPWLFFRRRLNQTLVAWWKEHERLRRDERNRHDAEIKQLRNEFAVAAEVLGKVKMERPVYIADRNMLLLRAELALDGAAFYGMLREPGGGICRRHYADMLAEEIRRHIEMFPTSLFVEKQAAARKETDAR